MCLHTHYNQNIKTKSFFGKPNTLPKVELNGAKEGFSSRPQVLRDAFFFGNIFNFNFLRVYDQTEVK